MRKLMLAAAALLALGGCTQFRADVAAVKTAFGKISTTQLSPTAVRVAIDLFDGVEVSAKNYLALPRCGGTALVCRNPAYMAPIIKAVKDGRAARAALEQFLAGHPGALGAQGAYDALQAAVSTLKSMVQ